MAGLKWKDSYEGTVISISFYCKKGLEYGGRRQELSLEVISKEKALSSRSPWHL